MCEGKDFSLAEAKELLRGKGETASDPDVHTALAALGMTGKAGWAHSAAEDKAKPLATELRRTILETAAKSKLRLWFSNREQSVWRTLEGLAKMEEAIFELHRIECALLGMSDEQAAKLLPDNLITVIASFQIYAKWRVDQRKLVEDCEKLAKKVVGSDLAHSDPPRWFESTASLSKKLESLLLTTDQIAGKTIQIEPWPLGTHA